MYPTKGQKGRAARDLSHLTNGSSASCYVLGYLYANFTPSTVHGTVTGGILVGKLADAIRVAEVIAYLGFSALPRTKPRTRDYVVSRISSVSLVELLDQIGCVASARERVVHEVLAQSPLFWRGFVDGNGLLDTHGLHILGSKALLQALVAFLAAHIPGQLTAQYIQRPALDEMVITGGFVPLVLQIVYQGTQEDQGLTLCMPHMQAAISAALQAHVGQVEPAG